MAVLTSSYYLFSPRADRSEELDSLKIGLSAPKRLPKSIEKVALEVQEGPLASEAALKEIEKAEGEADLADSEEGKQIEHTEEVAPVDHEKNWLDELSQIITGLEPEFGEEMFDAYVSERGSFQAGLDELVRENQKNQDIDDMIANLENQHEERIKEIFGQHYETIKEQQNKFLETTHP